MRLKRVQEGADDSKGYELSTVIPAPTIVLKRSFKEVNPRKLKPWDRNARRHEVQQLDELCRSISEFGFVKPVVIDEEDRLLAGHGACEAAKLLKLPKIPAVRIEGLTNDQKRAYVIADNKLAEKSTWDTDLLHLELSELKGIGVDLAALGFSGWTPETGDTQFTRPDPKTEHECPKCGYKF